MYKSLRPYVAELIGTFALVLLGAGAVCARAVVSDVATFDLTGIALAQGLVLAVMLTATINVSGGFLNPAVTVVLWVLRRIDTNKLGWLLLAQFLGAIMAGGLLCLYFGPGTMIPAHFGTPHVAGIDNPQGPGGFVRDQATGELTAYSMATAAGVELVLTFLLTFAIFSTVLDPRTPKIGGLGVGLIMVAIVVMGYNLTGAGVNPARCLGTFVWELAGSSVRPSVREHVFVYWVGPIVGALLAGWVYTYLVMHSEEEERQAAIEAAAHAHAHGAKK
jgi:MIP family channel proteins